jgi:ATP-dependent Clp protease ATP-binding subunit ClpX
MEGIELKVTEPALDLIAEKAIEFDLGARGLRSLVESIMMDSLYSVPSETTKDTFKIDVKFIKSRLEGLKLSELKVA